MIGGIERLLSRDSKSAQPDAKSQKPRTCACDGTAPCGVTRARCGTHLGIMTSKCIKQRFQTVCRCFVGTIRKALKYRENLT